MQECKYHINTTCPGVALANLSGGNIGQEKIENNYCIKNLPCPIKGSLERIDTLQCSKEYRSFFYEKPLP
jgi:hypothetical protein